MNGLIVGAGIAYLLTAIHVLLGTYAIDHWFNGVAPENAFRLGHLYIQPWPVFISLLVSTAMLWLGIKKIHLDKKEEKVWQST